MERVSVKNYRSILDSGDIYIKPLTVLLGKNSAGKSSFVRLFPLLKQTLERKISDTLLWYGDYVDFGDFKNTLSAEKEDKPIEMSISVMSEYIHRWNFLRRNKSNDKVLVRVELAIREKYIESVKIVFLDQSITMNISEDGAAEILVNDDNRPFLGKNIYVLRKDREIIPNPMEKVEMFRELSTDNNVYTLWPISFDKLSKKYMKYIYEGKKKPATVGIEDVEMLRPLPLELEMRSVLASKGEILSMLRRINPDKFNKKQIYHKRFEKINNFLIAKSINSIIETVNTAIFEDLMNTSYLKPIRAMVNRYYRVQGISVDKLDSDGSNLPMILRNMTDSELVEFEKWSKEQFGVVFSVTRGDGHISLIIKNEVYGNTITNVADTGYGYSQILPIVMLLWIVHNDKARSYLPYIEKTIVIEQPELHLHPAYQAKMMDVFVNIIRESEKRGIKIKIIFETHSETMINRLGTLISRQKLDPGKVNILVFDKTNGKTTISSKSFDREGLLLDWPIDFFAVEE